MKFFLTIAAAYMASIATASFGETGKSFEDLMLSENSSENLLTGFSNQNTLVKRSGNDASSDHYPDELLERANADLDKVLTRMREFANEDGLSTVFNAFFWEYKRDIANVYDLFGKSDPTKEIEDKMNYAWEVLIVARDAVETLKKWDRIYYRGSNIITAILHLKIKILMSRNSLGAPDKNAPGFSERVQGFRNEWNSIGKEYMQLADTQFVYGVFDTEYRKMGKDISKLEQ